MPTAWEGFGGVAPLSCSQRTWKLNYCVQAELDLGILTMNAIGAGWKRFPGLKDQLLGETLTTLSMAPVHSPLSK